MNYRKRTLFLMKGMGLQSCDGVVVGSQHLARAPTRQSLPSPQLPLRGQEECSKPKQARRDLLLISSRRCSGSLGSILLVVRCLGWREESKREICDDEIYVSGRGLGVCMSWRAFCRTHSPVRFALPYCTDSRVGRGAGCRSSCPIHVSRILSLCWRSPAIW